MASVSFYNLARGTALHAPDILAWVDTTDTDQSPQGSTLGITVTNFFATIPAPVNITSAGASSFAVGRLGATTPAFSVDSSTALQVAGLKVVGAVTTGTVALVVTDSGAVNTNLTINALGSGTIWIGSVSMGRVTITPVVTITGALTQTGLATFNGGATVASGQTLTVTSATITGLTAASVGTGTFPGVYTVTGALTLSGLLTANAGATVASGQTLTLTGATVAGSPTWSNSQAFAAITTTSITASSDITIANNKQLLGKDRGGTARNLIYISGDNPEQVQLGTGPYDIYISSATIGSSKLISVGAADSGGAGYRVLRVPN